MKINLLNTVAFSGHRDYAVEYDPKLRDTINSLYAEGYRCFISGVAVGFDLSAAEAVLALRDAHADVELVCAIPFVEQALKYSTEDRLRYEHVLERADRVVYISQEFHPACYKRRNDYLVDNSSVVVAYLNRARSGTGYTVRRAMRRALRVINLIDSTDMTTYIDKKNPTLF